MRTWGIELRGDKLPGVADHLNSSDSWPLPPSERSGWSPAPEKCQLQFTNVNSTLHLPPSHPHHPSATRRPPLTPPRHPHRHRPFIPDAWWPDRVGPPPSRPNSRSTWHGVSSVQCICFRDHGWRPRPTRSPVWRTAILRAARSPGSRAGRRKENVYYTIYNVMFSLHSGQPDRSGGPTRVDRKARRAQSPRVAGVNRRTRPSKA